MRAIKLSEEDSKSIPNKMTTAIVYDIAEIYINRLEQENKQLKEKIDKIREHCKKEYFIDESGKSVIDKADRILEILGDKENE